MKTLRTHAQAAQWMDEQGLSKAELARRFGVTRSLVDAILRGQKKCRRGASHNIAVFLGLKRGQAVAGKQPGPKPAARPGPAQGKKEERAAA
ncbi:helix-turn-helix domain-containing protein [Vandammella animalimorsus]|uniref:helix-turn-helix domain-containing protein n=1 Tax=Vandammella animalimorsus TaxID=2029117 RepID=UPI00325BB8F9